jgi:tetratricopeptide (TPR) repeat protein
MKRIIQDIQLHLKNFVNNSRRRLLVISCAPENSTLLLKSFDVIEDDPAVADIFLAFGHPFAGAEPYVDAAIASLRGQYDQVSGEFIKRGDNPLPPMPEEPVGGSLTPPTPEARLLNFIQHIRGVVPREQRVIWLFYPMEVNEPHEYLRLIDFIREGIASLRGVKLIIRDNEEQVLLRNFNKYPEAQFYQPPLEPDKLMKELAGQANDPRTPPEEQAQIHMMLAGLDVSEGRFEAALARNQELLGYFRHTGQRHHQSIVFNNIGDIYYIQNQLDPARESYEQAIQIAVEEKSEPLVIYQSINLGNVLQRQQKFDEALVYYQAAEQLADKRRTLAYQIQALEQIGAVRRQTRQLDEAAAALEKATDLGRKFHFEYGLHGAMTLLLNIYQEMGDTERFNERLKTLIELGTRKNQEAKL